jgi:trk system potassium uptake protein TrkA
MYIVILGAGTIGTAIAKWLLSIDHEVSVIDTNASRCAALDEELGSVSVIGNGTDASILIRAGCNRSDVFIGTSGFDEDNLVACQLARNEFGALKTIAFVKIPEHEELFTTLGIDVVINQTDILIDRLKSELGGSDKRAMEIIK